jgi:hypothetical protein
MDGQYSLGVDCINCRLSAPSIAAESHVLILRIVIYIFKKVKDKINDSFWER